MGLFIQGFLPEHHLRSESRDAIKLGAGLIATMAALVLGLLVGSAKSSFDAVNAGVVQEAAKAIMLDRLLAQYGPEAAQARAELKGSFANAMQLLWPEHGTGDAGLSRVEAGRGGEQVSEMLRRLSPQTEVQRSVLAQALPLSSDMVLSRWVLIEQQKNTLPATFLIVLTFWLAMLNATYGLFAPRNLTVITVLLVCALSIAASILLILEMNHPFRGLITASDAPMRNALAHLGE